MNDKKFILKSKTFWLNTLGIVGASAGLLPITLPTVIVGAAANLILRTVTDKGVTLTNPPEETKPLIKDDNLE